MNSTHKKSGNIFLMEIWGEKIDIKDELKKLSHRKVVQVVTIRNRAC
jgi:hypothetical protein